MRCSFFDVADADGAVDPGKAQLADHGQMPLTDVQGIGGLQCWNDHRFGSLTEMCSTRKVG